MVQSNKRKNSSRRIAILGIFTGILLIQNFVPFLGNIPIPPVNPTIIHVTVIVASLTLGAVDGMIVGGLWGVIRVIRALTMPANPLDLLLWINPVITVIPRLLIGLFAGLSYNFLENRFPKKPRMNMSISAVIGSLTNTIFVLLFIYLFFFNSSSAIVSQFDASNLGGVLVFIIVTGGIPEAILAGIIVPLIAKPIQKIYRR